MIRTFAEWIGTVFYLGKLPLAPGTWTSLVATIVWYFIFKAKESEAPLMSSKLYWLDKLGILRVSCFSINISEFIFIFSFELLLRALFTLFRALEILLLLFTFLYGN